MEPSVPGPNNTQLGRIIKRKFDEAMATGNVLDDNEFREIAAKFRAVAAQKGLNLKEV